MCALLYAIIREPKQLKRPYHLQHVASKVHEIDIQSVDWKRQRADKTYNQFLNISTWICYIHHFY